MYPSSTLGSITGAIASPRLGAPPPSHNRTRSVTSSWYSVGGSTVSWPSSGCTTTAGPGGPASEPNANPLPPCHDRPAAGSRQVAVASSHAVLIGRAQTFVLPLGCGSHT